jgi:hypothetical protein
VQRRGAHWTSPDFSDALAGPFFAFFDDRFWETSTSQSDRLRDFGRFVTGLFDDRLVRLPGAAQMYLFANGPIAGVLPYISQTQNDSPLDSLKRNPTGTSTLLPREVKRAERVGVKFNMG